MRVRLNLVMPIGVIVAVAVICVVVAVLTSAHRADEVSLDREQQLVQQAIVARGERMSARGRERRGNRPRHARDPRPTTIRNGWSAASAPGCRPSSTTTSLSWSMVPIRSSTSSSALPAIPPACRPARAACAESRSAARAARRDRRAAPCGPRPQNPGKPGRRTALDPAVRSAGRRSSRRWRSAPRPISPPATTGAPIVLSVKYHRREHAATKSATGCSCRACARSTIRPKADGQQVTTSPTRRATPYRALSPGRRAGRAAEIMGSVLPFIAVAVGGFALLVGLMMRYMRRTDGGDRRRRNATAPPRPARSGVRAAEPHLFRRTAGKRHRARCGAAGLPRPCSTSTSITSRTSTTRSATTSATSSSSTSPSA